jgi:hypothetical protein
VTHVADRRPVGDQLHGLHLQLLRRLGGEEPVTHVADHRPVGDLAARHG